MIKVRIDFQDPGECLKFIQEHQELIVGVTETGGLCLNLLEVLRAGIDDLKLKEQGGYSVKIQNLPFKSEHIIQCSQWVYGYQIYVNIEDRSKTSVMTGFNEKITSSWIHNVVAPKAKNLIKQLYD